MLNVTMADGSVVVVRKLLTDGGDNPKLNKSNKDEVAETLTYGLSLAPSMSSGYQVCVNASPGCIKACIFRSGYASVFKSINVRRTAKTRAWFQNREAFKRQLVEEIARAERRAVRAGKRLAIRLNVFSDIPWERTFPSLFTRFSGVQFYDYTKSARRAAAFAVGEAWPTNYHLTFSRSETNEQDCLAVLEAGGSVTVVFESKRQPATWNDYPVVNGDKTDLRFLDPRGVVVGLYAKGRGKQDETGFVVREELPVITL